MKIYFADSKEEVNINEVLNDTCSYYSPFSENDKIIKELADLEGLNISNVHFYQFTGYTRIPKYQLV